MKIIFLLRLWPVYGGGESVTLRLANEFNKRGIDVHIVYFKKSFCDTKPIIRNGIIDHYIEGVKCNENITDETISDKVSSKICSIINEYGIDIVINQWWPLSYTKYITTDTRARLIWCLHSNIAPYVRPINRFERLKRTIFKDLYEKRRYTNAVENIDKILPFVDKFVFLSPAYVNTYFEYSKMTSLFTKVTAIPNPSTFEINDNGLCIDNKENIVLIVSRLDENIKHLSRAFAIWKMIEKSTNKDILSWRLIVVGDGPSTNIYKNFVSINHLQRVSFVGFQNPTPYYKQSRILLMTSSCEGYPMTILEAKQFGVIPLVMNSTIALKDMIVNREDGIISPLGKIHKMKQELVYLMTHEEKLKSMAHKAVKSQVSNIDSVINLWTNLFNEIQLKNI